MAKVEINGETKHLELLITTKKNKSTTRPGLDEPIKNQIRYRKI